MTPAHVVLGQFVDRGADEIIRLSIDPWLHLRTDTGLQVKRLNGTEIAYRGVEFEGSPRHIFWDSGYIDPFLQAYIDIHVTSAAKTAREQGHDVGIVLDFVAGRLKSNVSRILSRMVEVDRRLVGKGFPDEVKPRSVVDKEVPIFEYLDSRVRVEHWVELGYVRSVLFETSIKASTSIDVFSSWLLAGVAVFVGLLLANQEKLEWLVPPDRLLVCLAFLVGILLLAIAQKGCNTIVAARGAGYKVGRDLLERGSNVGAPSVIVSEVAASSLAPFRGLMRNQLRKILAGDQLADARSTFRLSQYQSICASMQLMLVLAMMIWLIVVAAVTSDVAARTSPSTVAELEAPATSDGETRVDNTPSEARAPARVP